MSRGLLYIKKRNFPEGLTCLVLILPLLLSFFIDFLHLPSFVKYLIDIAIVLILASSLLSRRVFFRAGTLPLVVLIVGFFLYTLIMYLFNYQSIVYYLWGLRNNFRFYIAFLAFILFFDQDDAGFFINLLDKIFWVNAVVSFAQFVMGYRQDYLGGLFGVEKGCNAYSIIFFSIVIGKSLLSFMEQKENALPCFSKCGVSLIIAAMAELKFYFVIFVLILVFSAVFTRFSWKKIAIMIILSLVIFVAGILLADLFGSNNTLSFNRIWELVTAENYATAEDLGRFTAIPTIAKTILTKIPEQLFGMGLGNCDTSTFAICNTPFYQSHANLHYTWFSSAFLFLETGYFGLLAYLSFFIICFCLAWKQMRNDTANVLFCRLSMMMALLCLLLTFYNSSLRMEVAYIAYFALALPFIKQGVREQSQSVSL
ncbi:MAG: hypothetical protein IKD04_02670 [Clostridia bacterium]|nr:hypothetical protein [Clostridia bacterium]